MRTATLIPTSLHPSVLVFFRGGACTSTVKKQNSTTKLVVDMHATTKKRRGARNKGTRETRETHLIQICRILLRATSPCRAGGSFCLGSCLLHASVRWLLSFHFVVVSAGYCTARILVRLLLLPVNSVYVVYLCSYLAYLYSYSCVPATIRILMFPLLLFFCRTTIKNPWHSPRNPVL